MILNFLLICKDCAEKTQDLKKASLCNIHNAETHFELTCFNCGRSEVFIPDHLHKTTKKEVELERERKLIEAELAVRNEES